MTEEADRIAYIAAIRERMKHLGITIKLIAVSTGRSPQWIGSIFQGNYPQYKAYRLPQYLTDYLASLKLLPEPAVSELTDPKVGDMATVLVPNDERHIKDLWWWDGARCVITDTHDGRCKILTTDGREGWFARRMLVLVNEEVQP